MSQKNKGIILIITSAFFFALMNMMVRLAGDLPSIEKSFFRNFVAVFFAASVESAGVVSVTACVVGSVR